MKTSTTSHRPHVRIGGLAALVLCIVVIASACTPSAGAVERGAAATALRSVGVPVTSNDVTCTSTSSTSTICDIKAKQSAAYVTTSYTKTTATAKVVISGYWLAGKWKTTGGGGWTVSCSASKRGTSWSIGSCSAPRKTTT
jgi:hypothetical protein